MVSISCAPPNRYRCTEYILGGERIADMIALDPEELLSGGEPGERHQTVRGKTDDFSVPVNERDAVTILFRVDDRHEKVRFHRYRSV